MDKPTHIIISGGRTIGGKAAQVAAIKGLTVKRPPRCGACNSIETWSEETGYQCPLCGV